MEFKTNSTEFSQDPNIVLLNQHYLDQVDDKLRRIFGDFLRMEKLVEAAGW